MTPKPARALALALLFLASLAAPLLSRQAAGGFAEVAGEPGDLLVAARSTGITYHGGPVLIQARMVFIFWGPSFADLMSPDSAYAQSLQAYRNQLGTSPEYNIITQYYEIVGGVKEFIEKTNLAAGTPDEFDSSTPPTNVTDADVQAEVRRYLAAHTFNDSSIYAVVIPSTSYSSDSGDDSCGGPNLAYCSYHNWFTTGSSNVKYTIQPYPSCTGCQVSGWTPAQNQEHFIDHETVNSVTDPVGTGWYSATTGEEIGNLCEWGPPPFLAGVYAYQYVWSSATSSCVKTR